MIADLVLVPKNGINAWIAIEDEIRMAEASVIPDDLVKHINRDLLVSAMEGMTEERKAKIRQRAAWLANRFASERRKAGTLFCDKWVSTGPSALSEYLSDPVFCSMCITFTR